MNAIGVESIFRPSYATKLESIRQNKRTILAFEWVARRIKLKLWHAVGAIAAAASAVVAAGTLLWNIQGRSEVPDGSIIVNGKGSPVIQGNSGSIDIDTK